MLQAFWFDFRHTLRSLLNNPIFTLVSVVMLAIGLGLVLFMFGAIQSLVVQLPPFEDAERIVHVELSNTATGQKNLQVGLPTYLYFVEHQNTLSTVGAFYTGTANLTDSAGTPKRFEGTFVTDGVFETLKTKAYIGRTIQEQDLFPGAGRVVVLGYELWQQNYAGNALILNQVIVVNGEPATVIGVMPKGFRFPTNSDVWVPMVIPASHENQLTANSVKIIGRMKGDDVGGMAAVKENLEALLTNYKAMWPHMRREDHVDVVLLGDDLVLDVYVKALNVMLAAVGLVMLVACANVAGLLGARSATRRREQVIRSVLGATRARLFWAGILESFLITVIATALGVVIAYLCGNWFMAQLGTTENPPPSWALKFRIDFYLIIIAIIVMAMSAFLAGFSPAWRSSRISEGQTMRQGGNAAISSGIGWAGKYLITLEIAISLVLLVSAGLMARSFINAGDIPIGANVQNVFTGRIALINGRYLNDPEGTQYFLQRVLNNLSNDTNVGMSTITSMLPMTNVSTSIVAAEDQALTDENLLPVSVPISVADNYFPFFRIPLTVGRNFTPLDTKDSESVVIISNQLAEKLWPNKVAVGQRMRVKDSAGQFELRRVVGVVGDVQYDGRRLGLGSSRGVVGAYYLPLTQSDRQFWSLAVRSHGESGPNLESLINKAVRSEDQNMPVYWMRSMEEWISLASSRHKLLMELFSSFGMVALCLTAAGLYSLLSFTVTRKTREIGVYRALGAPSYRIIKTIMSESLKQVVAGSVLGLLLSLLFARLLSFFLINISPFDPASFLAAVLFFIVVCFFAALVPALRAVHITPMQALRYE